VPTGFADQVIMKDGTVYKGKIQIDNGKAILIGNPPFDPTAYVLENKDIEKVIYEEYHMNPPAERRRGLLIETRLDGVISSSDELPLGAAPALYLGAGFRVHPLLEFDGGFSWAPSLSAKFPLQISDTATPPNVRRYEDFHMLRGVFAGRIYPFYKKPWKWEPYVTAGYSWGHLTPSGAGDDTLSGGGWLAGFGAHYPLSTHFFVDGRFAYESLNIDKINFLGHDGTLNPSVDQKNYVLSLGLSWRL
jgi:hypothetical protein